MSSIPVNIIELVAETSERKADKQRLVEIRDYINRALAKSDACISCGRALSVPQQLDFVDFPEGKVCIPCVLKSDSVVARRTGVLVR